MKISVIIPTLNEEECLSLLIPHLQLNSGKIPVHEVIVADRGSSDQTILLAENLGVHVVHCEQQGRAAQMNAGANAATGDVLYFVHADTFPPKNYVDFIAQKLLKPSKAGCFTSVFDWAHPFYVFLISFRVCLFGFVEAVDKPYLCPKACFMK